MWQLCWHNGLDFKYYEVKEGKEGKIDSNYASPPKIWRNKVGKRATNRKSEGGPVKGPTNKNDPNRRLKPNDRYAHEIVILWTRDRL